MPTLAPSASSTHWTRNGSTPLIHNTTRATDTAIITSTSGSTTLPARDRRFQGFETTLTR